MICRIFAEREKVFAFREFFGSKRQIFFWFLSSERQKMPPKNSPHTLYSEIVGSVLYLSVITRADIAYSVGVLTRHMKKPTYDACIAACRLLLYLKKTRNRGLRYHGRALNLHAFTDSDWAGDLDTRRSTSGYVWW